MTDDRLAWVRADLSRGGGWGANHSHELLAEVDRLRALLVPDPGEEARLAALRAAAADDRRNRLQYEWRRDVRYLLARLAAAHNLFYDQQVDDAEGRGLRAAGAAEGWRRCVRALGALSAARHADGASISGAALADAAFALRVAPADLPPPLPPEASRARADRLEGAIRKTLAELRVRDLHPENKVLHAEHWLAEALGGD